jgi:pilus assembly protein CpaB
LHWNVAAAGSRPGEIEGTTLFGARRSVTLLLALIMGVAAAAAVYALVSKDQDPSLAAPNALPTSTAVPTTPVLIARHDIAAGTQLTEDLVEVRDIPTELRNNRALSSEDQAVGKIAAVALVQGEQILDTRVTDSPVAVNDTFAGTVPIGKRAISVVFDEVIGAGALVQPGDHVDVLAFFELEVKDFTIKSAEPTATSDENGDNSDENEPDYKQYVSTYIVQNVEVLAVSQAVTPDELGVNSNSTLPTPTPAGTSAATDEAQPVARPDAKSVTLAVTPEEAQRLLLAAQTVKNEKGSLRLAMRAPGDTTTVDLDAAQLGNIPLGELLGDVNQPMVPTDVVITQATFTQRVLASGTVLEFQATVKNISDRTIKSGSDAPPEYEYTQGVAYDALGFFPKANTYRIGLSFAGAYPNQYPYRWALGQDLEPGQSVDVVGSVRLTEPTAATKYWLGVIQEPNVVTQDGVNVSDITVVPSESGTVSTKKAELRSDPSASAAVVVELEKGADLEIVQARGAWFQVRSGKSEGWIEASSVTVPPLGATDSGTASSSDTSQSADSNT